MSSPFRIRKDHSIYFLDLNTPNSSVNVFNRPAAEQLNHFLDQFNEEPPKDAKLLVMQSTKPYSFLNGAELILTHSIHTQEDLEFFTRKTQSAYLKIEQCPVPTVALINGNCFGCGLEFSLHFDYRISTDSYASQFYLTEIKDYFLLPVFGSIERLPPLVGIQDSVDLLIWGNRWDAARSLDHGLIDYILELRQLDQTLPSLLEKLSIMGKVKRKKAKDTELDVLHCESDAMKKILDLPPEFQPLYTRGLELLISQVSTSIHDQHSLQANHINYERSAETSFSEASRKATSFFFVRTMANIVSIGSSNRIPSLPVEICIPPAKKDPFQWALEEKKLPHLILKQLDQSEAMIEPKISFLLRARSSQNESIQIPFKTYWEYQLFNTHQDYSIYFPLGNETDFCEVFLDLEKKSEFQDFLKLVIHLGWNPLVLSVGNESVSNQIIRTVLESYVDLISSGKSNQDLNHSFWMFGFEILPFEFIEKFSKNKIQFESHEFKAGEYDLEILNQFFLKLEALRNSLIQSGQIRHSSQFDVAIRSILKFPLTRGGFSQYFAEKTQKEI